MRQSKERIIAALKEQLKEEQIEAQDGIYHDPDGWQVYCDGLAELTVAIALLEVHDWEEGDEGDDVEMTF